MLDSDEAGLAAKKKIGEHYLKPLSESEGNKFQVIMIKEAAGLSKTDAAIEDLFPDDFYLDLVNECVQILEKNE